jgi:hypothetical protein
VFDYNDDLFETIIFSTFINKVKINFIISYNPHYQNKGYLDHLECMLQKVNLAYKSIIIGDLNHDLLSEKGDSLMKLANIYNFINNVNEATRITQSSKTLLDVILCNDLDLIQCTKSIPSPFSDHHFIYGILKLNSSAKSNVIKSRCLDEKK